MLRSNLVAFLIILLAFAADRLAKVWVAAFLAENGTTRINDLFTLTETYNRGLAFGTFQGIGFIVGWLSVIVVLGLGHFPRSLAREYVAPAYRPGADYWGSTR